ncbi:ABC transporter ATP-binding protein [Motiliproteus sp. MSK22-1]|nr:ABC transporter ATP-binding protein [Motiliproteus sp. MSK22-1]
MLQVIDLGFSYGAKQALKNINFELITGRFHALLGPNGAGKTTLFALISRLFNLQEGDILLDGCSLRKAPAQVLSNVGMVFQQSTLDLDLSVAENLHYHASLHGIGEARRRQRIAIELARVEMENYQHTRVRTLNGGHRRRIEIARALLHQPRLLLLDEATVGLDTRARTEINKHVRKLCMNQEVGVLWATHLIEEIDPNDPVTLLHKGQVLANANSLEICQRSGHANLVEAFESLTRPQQVKT